MCKDAPSWSPSASLHPRPEKGEASHCWQTALRDRPNLSGRATFPVLVHPWNGGKLNDRESARRQGLKFAVVMKRLLAGKAAESGVGRQSLKRLIET